MSTALRKKGSRFFFFSNDRSEPPHIHVEASGNYAKFWLEPVRLSKNNGFKAHELNEISQYIIENKSKLEEAWHEFFSSS